MSEKHLSDKVLCQHNRSELKHGTLEKVDLHLRSCRQCRNRLRELSDDDDDDDSDSDWDSGLGGSTSDSVTHGNLSVGDLDADEHYEEATESGSGVVGKLPPGYEVLSELGRGGMGVVLKVRGTSDGRVVALKLLQAAGLADPQARERLRREAKTIAQLKHPGIVRVFNVIQHEGKLLLELELVDGGTLSNYIFAPCDARWSATMLLQIAQAVAYFHARDIVHRDLKPENVLMGHAKTDNFVWTPPPHLQDVQPISVPRAKITDFGLAKQLDDSVMLTLEGQVLGTPLYMAPEQTRREGANRFTTKVDIHALGLLLYALLTGHSPFKGNNVAQTLKNIRKATPTSPKDIVESVPSDLAGICLKCLKKDPNDRYESADDLARDLELFLQGESLEPKGGLISRLLKRLGDRD